MAAILALGGSPSGMRREAELSRTVSLPVTPIAHSNPAYMHGMYFPTNPPPLNETNTCNPRSNKEEIHAFERVKTDKGDKSYQLPGQQMQSDYVATFNKRNIAEVYLKAITEFPVMGVVVSLLGLLKRSQMERVMTLRPTDDYGCYDDPQSFVYRWLQMVMEDTVQVADQWAIAWILEVSSLVLRVANGDERY
ncbi:hypothetical protein Tco_1524391 [Tanacetum coccineum]